MNVGSAREAPVLIVGGGPVGLALGCGLLRLGVGCRIVDAGEGPTPEGESRALGLQARTMEVFAALGVAGALLEAGLRVRGGVGWRDRRRIFRTGMEGIDGETAFPFILSIPQGATERILLDRLGVLGGRVEWRTSLTGLRQGPDGVLAELLGGDGRSAEAHADWLVGCDGARSVVRERLGLRFEGASYPERFLLADVEIDWPLPRDHAHLLITPEGIVPAIPLPGDRAWRLIDTTDRLDSDAPAAIMARFADLLREHAPADRVTLGAPAWTSSFRIHRRAAERFRVERCFVAGDAAHVHSPVGGQGLNTGVQDAFNLSWKLALVARGEAPESLLDSYDAERRPVAEAVLAGTDRATRMVTLRNPLLQGVRNTAIAALLKLPPVRRRLARAVAELDISYRDGPLSAEDWTPDPLSGLAGPRPGDRLPDLPLGPEGRLHDFARGPWFTLLIFAGADRPTAADAGQIRSVLDRVAGSHADRVAAVAVVGPGPPPGDGLRVASARIDDREGRLHRRFGSLGPSLYLIRPDGHVSYRCRPPDAGRLERALHAILNPCEARGV